MQDAVALGPSIGEQTQAIVNYGNVSSLVMLHAIQLLYCIVHTMIF